MKALARTLLALLVLLVGAAAGCGVYALRLCADYDRSMSQVYAIPLPEIARSEDPEIVARGRHLAESLGECATRMCHGSDLGGGVVLDVGPLGNLTGPNVTQGGLGAAYSDGELARLIQHGVKRDGRSARFMPSEDFGWLPDSDVRAIVSYVRALPASDRSTPPVSVQPLAKILDGLYDFPIDVARRTDHARTEVAPAPAPTAAYGAFVARLCRPCHGPRFSGGRIPGAPPAMVTPLNLTPDATGLEGWTFEDFERTMKTGVRKNGMPLSPFMPIDGWRNLDDVELRALWAYLTALPPLAFGNR